MKNLLYTTLGFLLALFTFASCTKTTSSPLEEITVNNTNNNNNELYKRPGGSCSTPAVFRAVYNSYDGTFCNYYLELSDGRYIYPEPSTFPKGFKPADGKQVTIAYTELEPVGTFPECYPAGHSEIMGVLLDCIQEVKGRKNTLASVNNISVEHLNYNVMSDLQAVNM